MKPETAAHLCIAAIVLVLTACVARAALAQESAPQLHAAARARTAPTGAGPGGLQPTDALTLARVCWLESNWSHADCTAIGHVIRVRAKRAGSTFAEMAIAYSAIDSGTERARLAAQLPDGDESTWGKGTNERWLRLRLHARAVLAGRAANPCKGASHWGARVLPNDVRRAVNAIEAGRWRVVECSEQTSNAFYAEGR
jgi:hypothetical protein